MRRALALALLLAGCGQGPGKEPVAANQRAEINALAADVEQLEADIRLRRLEERIGAVEAQLGNLAIGDEELRALDKRVKELEARGAMTTAKPPAPQPKPTP